MNFLQCLKAKLESAHFFKVQSGKKTVCFASWVKQCTPIAYKMDWYSDL